MKRHHSNHNKETHDYYLETLINNLDSIGENRRKIHWIMKDGIWIKENSYDHNKLCDLILVYYDNHAIPVELKGSSVKYDSAVLQIDSGRRFITDVLNLSSPYGIFVVYSNNCYYPEKVFFDRTKRVR
jgi:hypothetical protein